MTITRDNLCRAAYWAALGSAVSILLSIFVSQRLLELSLVLLLLSRARLRLPRVWLPLALFILGTLISVACSPDPMRSTHPPRWGRRRVGVFIGTSTAGKLLELRQRRIEVHIRG